jgi:hypothetical protein
MKTPKVDRTTKLTRNNPRICRLFSHADHMPFGTAPKKGPHTSASAAPAGVVSLRPIAYGRAWRFDGAMPRDPFIREKFTKERTAARKLTAEYFERFPKGRYLTEVESWRELQSQNIDLQ